MRFIPTRIHGWMDYIAGVLFIALPWLLGFAAGGAETWIFVILGAGMILYSLMTDYELGLVKAIPMPVHLWIDVGAGVLLAVSPWLFGFADFVWVPHLLLGLVAIGSGLFTETHPPRTAIEERQQPRRAA